MKLTKRKDGRWQYNFSTGKGKKTKPFYSRLPDEKKAEKDIIKKISAYRDKEINGEKFAKIADKWNTDYRNKNSEINYKKNIKAAYNRILKYFGNEVYIKDITASEVSQFINKLIAQKYSKKTVSTHKSVMNMIFTYAIISDYIKINPVQSIKLPAGLPKNPRKMPTTEEIKIVSSHHEGFDLLPFFLLYSGCRKSEALAITDSDIDRKNKLIKIRNHVIHDGNEPIFEPVLKTDNAERDVILLDRLAEAIPEKFNGFLFSMDGSGEKPLTKRAYDKRLEKYCKEYGINITAHQLRHGYATMLFEAGIDIKDAQELMGHSDINLTRQIYTHIRSKRKEKTAEVLNKFNF